MKPKYLIRRQIVFWTVFPWLGLTFLHFSVWLRAIMAMPMSQEHKVDDLGFQLFSYLVFVLPIILGPMLVVGALEAAIFLFMDWRETRHERRAV